MTLRKHLATLLAFLLIGATPSKGEETSHSEMVGSVSFTIPFPEGFTTPHEANEELKKLGETLTPPTNRLLGVYFEKTDVNRFSLGEEIILYRYFMAQCSMKDQDRQVSVDQFSAVRYMFGTHFKEMQKNFRPKLDEFLNSASKTLGADMGVVDLKIGMGEILPIEVFQEDNTSIGQILATNVTRQSGGKTEEIPMLIATTIVLLKGRILYLCAYGLHRSNHDIAWIRESSLAWLERTRAMNISLN